MKQDKYQFAEYVKNKIRQQGFSIVSVTLFNKFMVPMPGKDTLINRIEKFCESNFLTWAFIENTDNTIRFEAK